MYLLKQLCSCYRITSEQSVVALLSFHCQQKTQHLQPASLCANHAMRQLVVLTSHSQQTQGCTCREYVGETNSLQLNLEGYFSEVTTATDCNLLCWYKPKVSTASKSV